MTVANFLNFSRAAEVLRITQPAVSHQINALENELGVKLFHRTSKSVRLTQAGYLFTQYADEILRISGLSKERLKAAQEVHSVRLGVGCRNFVDLRLMIPTLSQLATEEPLLLPLLRMTPFDSLENLLEEGDIQVLISHKKTSLKKAVYRELCLRPVVCLCSAQHPLAQLEQVSVHQLRDAGRMAICRPPIFSTELLDVQSQVVSGRNSEQILFCDNLEILYTLVEAGLAFAIISGPPFRSLFPIFGTFLCQRSLPSPLVLSTCRENSPPCFGDFSLCWRKIYKPIPMRYDHCTPNVPTLSQVGTFDASISKLD